MDGASTVWQQRAGPWPLRTTDGHYRVQELASHDGTRFMGIVFLARRPLDAAGPARLTIEQARIDCERHEAGIAEHGPRPMCLLRGSL